MTNNKYTLAVVLHKGTPSQANAAVDFLSIAQCVWFLVSAVEPIGGQSIEFVGEGGRGSIELRTIRGVQGFILPEDVRKVYPDVGELYPACHIRSSEGHEHWNQALRIPAPSWTIDAVVMPPPAPVKSSFVTICEEVAERLEQRPDVSKASTHHPEFEEMSLMVFMLPFRFNIDFKDGQWRPTLYITEADWKASVNGSELSAILVDSGSAEVIEQQLYDVLSGVRLRATNVESMRAVLYNGNNYLTSEEANADNAMTQVTEDVAGYGNILDSLLNMRKAARVMGGQDDLYIRMDITYSAPGRPITLPDCAIEHAVTVLDRVFLFRPRNPQRAR